jgi:peroxiredoxin
MVQDFRAAGAEILVIMCDSPARARECAERLKIPFPVLAEPEREVYHRLQLEREYMVVQRSASVLVDTDAVIRYFRRATNPGAWREEGAARISVGLLT